MLVDEAELVRLQQRQLREYSPELASLSRLKSDMDSILRRPNLSAQEKLTRLAAVQGRFEKTRKNAGVLSSSSAATATIALPPQVAAPPPTPDAGDEKDDDEEEEEDAVGKHKSEAEYIPDPLSPTSNKVRHLGVKGQY